MVWKFSEIWKILWELASRRAKLCEILSHSVRWDKACMYMSDNRKPIFRGMPTGMTVGVTPQIECRIQTHFLAYSGCMIQEIQ